MSRVLMHLALCAIVGGLLAPPAHAAKKAEFTRPPYAGAYEPKGVDERGLWMESDEDERKIRDFPRIVRDSKLNDYVHGVLCRSVGDDRCSSARIYIVQDNSFNAEMSPNGMMYVFTGLLVRMHSEAELSTVLGHEFAHFEQRHSLKDYRHRRTGTDIISWIWLAGAATAQNTSDTRNDIHFSFYSFDRAQEVEADFLSAKFVMASPYRLRGAEVWGRMLEEDNATREAQGLRKAYLLYPSITATHPTNLQRLAYYSKMESELGDVGEDGVDSFRAGLATILPSLLDDLIKGNPFATADYVIRSRGEAMGWDGQLYYTRGELYRLRANPRDLVTARDLFQQAIAQPDAPPESWRGLGLCAMRLGDTVAGKSALTEYLTRLPAAKDAASIKMVLEN